MRLDLVVGPNGAGKTTFVRNYLLPVLPPGTPYVNADEIAVQRWPENPEGKSYEAAKIAEATRLTLISSNLAFVAETVFSHPSKLDLIARARDAGYHVVLHALVVPENLSVLRVDYRVAAGGHSVPEDKIRQRYQRLWPLVVQAAKISDEATFYNNAAINGPETLVSLYDGIAVGAANWPDWVPTDLSDAWPSTP